MNTTYSFLKTTNISESNDSPIERAAEIRRQLRSERGDSTLVASKDTTSSNSKVKHLVSKDGRVLNSNQAQATFKLDETDDAVVLTVKIPK